MRTRLEARRAEVGGLITPNGLAMEGWHILICVDKSALSGFYKRIFFKCKYRNMGGCPI